VCELCTAGAFAGTSGECELCPPGSWSEEGSISCACEKGWTAAKTHTHTITTLSEGKTICIKCPQNTFKAVRGRQACQACPFSFSSPEASEDLMECVPQTAWSAATGAVSAMLKVCRCVFECGRESEQERKKEKEKEREREWSRSQIRLISYTRCISVVYELCVTFLCVCVCVCVRVYVCVCVCMCMCRAQGSSKRMRANGDGVYNTQTLV